MRYEVRIYNLEEMLPENRMTYIPCSSYEEAKVKYVDAIATYNDENHEVSLCRVTYLPWGESCRTIASTRNENPYHVIIEEEWLDKPEGE